MSQERTDSLVGYAIAAAPAAVGCAVGILLGGRLSKTSRDTAAVGMLAVGAAAALPFISDYVQKRVNAPGSKRGSQKRLNGIRQASGVQDAEELEYYEASLR